MVDEWFSQANAASEKDCDKLQQLSYGSFTTTPPMAPPQRSSGMSTLSIWARLSATAASSPCAAGHAAFTTAGSAARLAWLSPAVAGAGLRVERGDVGARTAGGGRWLCAPQCAHTATVVPASTPNSSPHAPQRTIRLPLPRVWCSRVVVVAADAGRRLPTPVTAARSARSAALRSAAFRAATLATLRAAALLASVAGSGPADGGRVLI